MAQGKVKSISVEVYDKESKSVTPAIMQLDLNAANALKAGSKFGSVGVSDIKLEDITVGDTTMKKVASFTIPEKSTDSEASLSIKAINFGFKAKDGKDYNIKKKVKLEASKIEGHKGLAPNEHSSKFLSDLGTVARAGFLGNKGKKHTDKDFFDGTTEIFQSSLYTIEDKKTGERKTVDEGTKGAQKIIYLDKVDPREVKKAVEFLNERVASKEQKAPEADVEGPGK